MHSKNEIRYKCVNERAWLIMPRRVSFPSNITECRSLFTQDKHKRTGEYLGQCLKNDPQYVLYTNSSWIRVNACVKVIKNEKNKMHVLRCMRLT